jgi:hypothetical protein
VTTNREDEDGYQKDDPPNEEGSKSKSRGTGRDCFESKRNCPEDHNTSAEDSSTSVQGNSTGSENSGTSSQNSRDESREESDSGQEGCQSGEAGNTDHSPRRHSRSALANDFRGGLFPGRKTRFRRR